MFRIGIFELGLTCGLLFIIILVPIIVTRYHARMDQRLKNIENKIDKQKE